jgi:hypothetical protein
VIDSSPIAVILIGISKFVRNADAVAPIVPKVEIIANPIGPQLHAPAAAPIKDPNTLPLIFLVDFLRILIR